MFKYLKFGNVPPAHHIAHYDGDRLLHEYCFTREGFEEPYSIFYLYHPPTAEERSEVYTEADWSHPATRKTPLLQRRHFQSDFFPPHKHYISGRLILAFNDRLQYGLCHPEAGEESFFANNDGDELFFLFDGQCEVQSLCGKIQLVPGDYLVVPRSCPYRFNFSQPPHLLYVESRGGIQIPRQFLNETGQFKMDAPYSERSFKTPAWDEDLFESDERRTIIRKREDEFTQTVYANNVFKMTGWDGYVYPYAINLDNIQPKTASVHLPPTSHLTFEGGGFAIMSFLPRVLDFDKRAIPCPFYHSSVNCDELLFYYSGNFTSRKFIGRGSISYHPSGIPHGPHPGAYKNAIGQKKTEEKAVMVDTYHPLILTQEGEALEDPDYPHSWKENPP